MTLRRDRPLWRAQRATFPLYCEQEPDEVLALDLADQVAGQVGQGPVDVDQRAARAGRRQVRGATDSGRSSRWRTEPSARAIARLDRVFQLADVPRPGVPQEGLHRVRGDLGDRRALLRAMLLEEMHRQERDVLGPLAQRGQVDPDHVEPVEQVGAEPALLDLVFEDLVRGRDDPDVDLDASRSRRRARTCRVCNTRSSLAWSAGGMSPTSSSSSVPPSASSNRPILRRSAPVNDPFSWPNSSLSSSESFKTAQLSATNGPARRRVGRVDRLGDQLLARPGLALDQDRRADRADLLDQVEDLAHLRALRNHRVEVIVVRASACGAARARRSAGGDRGSA